MGKELAVNWLLLRSLVAQVRLRRPATPKTSAAGSTRRSFFENDRLGSAALSAVAGYVDAAGLLSLLGHLPAHLTGELVTAAADFSTDRGFHLFVRIALIVTFVGSVAATAVIARVARRRGAAPLPSLLLTLSGALSIFCLLGCLFDPSAVDAAHDNMRLLLAGGGAVLAMGVQNALMREAMGTSCPTTVMTGNLTQFIIEIVELGYCRKFAAGDAESKLKRTQSNARLVRVGISLGCFLSGAFAGAWLTHRLGLVSIALPAAGVGLLALVARRDAQVVTRADC
jgi:uncharacterized membrane protein YoaK (UPF0700 family)